MIKLFSVNWYDPYRSTLRELISCLPLSEPCAPHLQRGSEVGEDEHISSGWRGFLSTVGLSIPAGLCRLAPPALGLGQRRMLQSKAPEVPEHVLRLAGVGLGMLRAEWSFPGFVSMFLPEFPHRPVPGHEHFQVEIIPKITTDIMMLTSDVSSLS